MSAQAAAGDAGTQACLVCTTVAQAERAGQLADAIVLAGLGACVQVLPMHSHYVWQGQLQRDDEHLLLIKTRQSLFAALSDFIRDRHDYEVPEIVQLPITAAAPDYLQWLLVSTSGPPIIGEIRS